MIVHIVSGRCDVQLKVAAVGPLLADSTVFRERLDDRHDVAAARILLLNAPD